MSLMSQNIAETSGRVKLIIALTEDVLADIDEKSQFLTRQGVVRNGVVDIRRDLVDKRYINK